MIVGTNNAGSNGMISITIYKPNCDNEDVSEKFEFKDNRLFIADINSESSILPFSSTPFKVYMTVRSVPDMQHLITICSKYEDVDIILEETPELYELISQIQDNSFGIALDWIEKALSPASEQVDHQSESLNN